MSKRLIVVLAAVLVVVVLIGGMALATESSRPRGFGGPKQAIEVLKEHPKCKTVDCLNRHIDRLEFLLIQLVRDEFLCTELGAPDPATGHPILVFTC